MKYVNVKKFVAAPTRYIRESDDIVVTKYGKPVAILSKVENNSRESLFLRLKEIVTAANLTKEELLKTLESVQQDLYA